MDGTENLREAWLQANLFDGNTPALTAISWNRLWEESSEETRKDLTETWPLDEELKDCICLAKGPEPDCIFSVIYYVGGWDDPRAKIFIQAYHWVEEFTITQTPIDEIVIIRAWPDI